MGVRAYEIKHERKNKEAQKDRNFLKKIQILVYSKRDLLMIHTTGQWSTTFIFALKVC